jgi:hypothetical protein
MGKREKGINNEERGKQRQTVEVTEEKTRRQK